jgi:hypothetical protein
VVVYRGKTVQGNVEQRFKQLLSDDAAKKQIGLLSLKKVS